MNKLYKKKLVCYLAILSILGGISSSALAKRCKKIELINHAKQSLHITFHCTSNTVHKRGEDEMVLDANHTAKHRLHFSSKDDHCWIIGRPAHSENTLLRIQVGRMQEGCSTFLDGGNPYGPHCRVKYKHNHHTGLSILAGILTGGYGGGVSSSVSKVKFFIE